MMEAPIAPFEAKKLAIESIKSAANTGGKRIRSEKSSTYGKCVASSRQNDSGKPHLMQSVLAQAVGEAGFSEGIRPENVRWQVLHRRAGTNIVFVVDASGSMLAKKKMEAAKGCVFSLLQDAYVCRDTVSMITFGGREAQILLQPTASVELASQQLKTIRTGGKTPLLDALGKAETLIDGTRTSLLVLVSDGMYTRAGITDPEGELRRFGAYCAERNARILVVDAEKKSIFSIGAAKRLAELLGAVFTSLDELRADSIRSAVDSVLKL